MTDIGDTAINKNISDLEKLIPSRKDRYKKIFFDTTVSASIAAAAAKSLQLCPTLCDPIDGSPLDSPGPRDSPGKNTGVGCHFLLQCVKVKLFSHV